MDIAVSRPSQHLLLLLCCFLLPLCLFCSPIFENWHYSLASFFTLEESPQISISNNLLPHHRARFLFRSTYSHPGRSGLDHHASDEKGTPGQPATPAVEDDFFNTWNQPKKASSSSSPQTAAPPVVGLGATSRVSTARPAKSTLTATRKVGTAAKPMKLGAKKTGTISFEEAEARAKAEAERIEKLGFEAAEEERLQKLATEKAKAEAASRSSQGPASDTRTNYYQNNMVSPADKSRTSSEDMERLGMGMGRMGFGAAPSSSSKAANGARFGGMGGGYSPQVEGMNDPIHFTVESDILLSQMLTIQISLPRLFMILENVTAAREKFGNQKAISSDQYFGRNNYDADAQAEASNRLQSFSGATSISSNQYFGRPEESPTIGSDGTWIGTGAWRTFILEKTNTTCISVALSVAPITEQYFRV